MYLTTSCPGVTDASALYENKQLDIRYDAVMLTIQCQIFHMNFRISYFIPVYTLYITITITTKE